MACGSGAFPQSSATHFFSVLFDLIGFHFISFDVERGVCSARQPNILSKHFGPQFESMVVPQVLLRIRVLVPIVYKRAEKVCMRWPPPPSPIVHCAGVSWRSLQKLKKLHLLRPHSDAISSRYGLQTKEGMWCSRRRREGAAGLLQSGLADREEPSLVTFFSIT